MRKEKKWKENKSKVKHFNFVILQRLYSYFLIFFLQLKWTREIKNKKTEYKGHEKVIMMKEMFGLDRYWIGKSKCKSFYIVWNKNEGKWI